MAPRNVKSAHSDSSQPLDLPWSSTDVRFSCPFNGSDLRKSCNTKIQISSLNTPSQIIPQQAIWPNYPQPSNQNALILIRKKRVTSLVRKTKKCIFLCFNHCQQSRSFSSFQIKRSLKFYWRLEMPRDLKGMTVGLYHVTSACYWGPVTDDTNLTLAYHPNISYKLFHCHSVKLHIRSSFPVWLILQKKARTHD